ncbi:MAG: hypothetical protein M3680_19135 [Myxococcota bacterium]|nr:hypothetical protein [Myxococcota bacterium]
MRTLLLAAATAAAVLAGCTDGTLSDDTAYRRLVDGFDSYDRCLADEAIVSCYQTLTLCANGRVLIDLDNRPQDGRYELEDNIATAIVGGGQIVFDLDRKTSTQLPGRHPWEDVTPSFYGCDTP